MNPKPSHVKLLRILSTVHEIFAALDSASHPESGDAGAGAFGDNGGDPDGDLWLQRVEMFSPAELEAACAAGAEIVDGWRADYAASTAHYGRSYCGYGFNDEAFTLDRQVALDIQHHYNQHANQ